MSCLLQKHVRSHHITTKQDDLTEDCFFLAQKIPFFRNKTEDCRACRIASQTKVSFETRTQGCAVSCIGRGVAWRDNTLARGSGSAWFTKQHGGLCVTHSFFLDLNKTISCVELCKKVSYEKTAPQTFPLHLRGGASTYGCWLFRHLRVLQNNPDRIAIWKCCFLLERGKPEYPEKTPRSKGENQQQSNWRVHMRQISQWKAKL